MVLIESVGINKTLKIFDIVIKTCPRNKSLNSKTRLMLRLTRLPTRPRLRQKTLISRLRLKLQKQIPSSRPNQKTLNLLPSQQPVPHRQLKLTSPRKEARHL